MYISTTPLQFKCTVYYIYHVWNRGQFGVAYISVWHLPIVGGSGLLSTLYIGTTCPSEDHVTIWGMDGVILHRLCFFYIMYLNKRVRTIYCGKFMLGLFSAIRLPMEADATAAAVDTICLVLSQVLSCSIGFWTFVFGFLLSVYWAHWYRLSNEPTVTNRGKLSSIVNAQLLLFTEALVSIHSLLLGVPY